MPDSTTTTAKAPGMTVEKLRTLLGPIQEAKGYPFNKDPRMTTDLLEQLLVNKERYGYMACPCRLANGVYEQDRDIICPCTYRDDDVAEFGECYCGLYVSPERNQQENPKYTYVPDRRPAEKILL